MTKKIEISEEIIKKFYYKEDMNFSQIARRLNVSHETISSRFKEHNLKQKDKIYHVNLPREELINMYTKEKLFITKIAEKFKCNHETICRRLREYCVEVNSRPHYKHIPKEILEELYIKNKLSTVKIAKKLKCSKSSIDNKLKIYGIKTRNHSEAGKLVKRKEKYKLPLEELKDLYYNKKLSMQQIADRYNIKYNSVIYHRFKKNNIKSRPFKEGTILSIPRRSRSIAKSTIIYPRKQFSEDLIEKSYLFGFAVGDLHITKRKYGTTVYMQTSTTKRVQVELIKNMFERYVKVNVYTSKFNQYNISCNLDQSFEFLLEYQKDEIPEWILVNKENFLSFLGGYIDAEGYFGIPNNYGTFALGSYDKNILFGIASKLKEFGINTEGPKITVKKGHIDKRGVKWNNDMWEIRIRRKRELYQFISLIKQYIKHKKRYNDMINVEENLLNRNKRLKVN